MMVMVAMTNVVLMVVVMVVAKTVVMTMVTTKSVIVKCEKCVFFKIKNQILKTCFLGFENESKNVSKMIYKLFQLHFLPNTFCFENRI